VERVGVLVRRRALRTKVAARSSSRSPASCRKGSVPVRVGAVAKVEARLDLHCRLPPPLSANRKLADYFRIARDAGFFCQAFGLHSAIVA
jgi:hypothetical protein